MEKQDNFEVKKKLCANMLLSDKVYKGRIGGNPPKVIEEEIPENYRFYMTIVNPENDTEMLSILVHKEFNVLLEKYIYPNIEIEIIRHKYIPFLLEAAALLTAFIRPNHIG